MKMIANNSKDEDNLTTCPVCGKKFIKAVKHIYKTKDGKYTCSYTCAKIGGWKG